MAKRVKRAEKGIESLKKEIEIHFKKIEEDFQGGNIDRGKYHLKEIDKSLLKALETKLDISGIQDDNSIQEYKERLEKLKKSLDLNEVQ